MIDVWNAGFPAKSATPQRSDRLTSETELLIDITTAAATSAITLDGVIDSVAQHAGVAGIMLLGTTGTDRLTPTSDLDILLVFGHLPAPMRMVNTWIDGRLAEVYCTTIAAIERVVADGATWRDGDEEGILHVWLREGRIVHDRSGQLAAASERAGNHSHPTPADEREIHEAWRKIGYNVAQIKRYLAADDPMSLSAVDMRLLYSVAEVNLHYFTVRQLLWRGEKPAIRYWLEHDPEYLDCFHHFSAETNRRHRVELYEELATRALAPVGRLWREGQTMIGVGAGYGSGELAAREGTVGDALAFWKRLVTDPS